MQKTKETRTNRGITLIALVITIVVLIILASIAIYLSLGSNGVFTRAKQGRETTNKQAATEIINLKITTAQMNKYAEKQEMPTLQELADTLYLDNEIEYVALETKVGTKEKIIVGNNTSIYTKLSKYPYEFEINSSLQLASINGVKIANNTGETTSRWKKYMMNEYGYAVGNIEVELPKKYSELYIKITVSEVMIYHFYIPYEALADKYETWSEGYGFDNQKNLAILNIKKDYIKIQLAYYNQSDFTNSAKMEIYYK